MYLYGFNLYPYLSFLRYDYSTFNLPDLNNRFLEGNGFGYIQAGLPNITGAFAGLRTDGGKTGTGVFQNNGNYYGYASANGSATNNSLSFDASRSSSIYGNSNTIQPATCKCYFIIKY